MQNPAYWQGFVFHVCKKGVKEFRPLSWFSFRYFFFSFSCSLLFKHFFGRSREPEREFLRSIRLICVAQRSEPKAAFSWDAWRKKPVRRTMLLCQYP